MGGVYQRVGRSAGPDVRLRARVECCDAIGLSAENPVRRADRLFERVRREQRAREQKPGLNSELLGLGGLLERPDREAGPARLHEGDTESVVRLGMIGFSREQHTQRRDRLVELSGGLQRANLRESGLAIVPASGRSERYEEQADRDGRQAGEL